MLRSHRPSAACKTAIHLCTSSISLAGSVTPPDRFAPHIFNKRTIPAVNAGSCGRTKKVSQPRLGNIIEKKSGSCLEMSSRVLWGTAALEIHHVCPGTSRVCANTEPWERHGRWPSRRGYTMSYEHD